MNDLAWVQLTVPAFSAKVLADILGNALAADDAHDVLNVHEYKIASDLRDFFEHAAENPRAFTPSGAMATRLKMRSRRVRGVRRNDGSLKDGTPRVRGRRKNRAERRYRAAKERRQHRAETASAFNAARDAIERELGSVEGHRLLAVAERQGSDTGGSPGRAEGQDPDAHVQG